MSGRKVLSPFSFYGGKEKMAPLICQMLDYRHTDIYLEPFGGACRVLLNKPRHREEIYNDFGYGLRSFFEVLGNPSLSKELISQLNEVVPSEEVFYDMLKYKAEHEQELTENLQRQASMFFWNCGKKYDNQRLKNIYKFIRKKEYGTIINLMKEVSIDNPLQEEWELSQFDSYQNLYMQYWEIIKSVYEETYREAEMALEAEWKKNEERLEKKYKRKKQAHMHSICHEVALEAIKGFTGDILTSNGADQEPEPIQMAKATFLTYYLSRDGMGLNCSTSKVNAFESYYNYLCNLKDVAERFEGVTITQVDALLLINQYLGSENVMMYLDPSYLNPEDEKKDLGKNVYSRSSDYEDHKRLLTTIQKAKAKIMISNYDVALYNDYLTPEFGWRKIYYDTTTSVGSRKGNTRVEVLWYNY